MTARPPQSLFSLHARVARLLPIQTRPPSTTDRNPRTLPPRPCNRRRTRRSREIPSFLQPMRARLTEHPLPSRTTPTESKPRSRSTNSCSACASSSSNSQTRLNNLSYKKKWGSQQACPGTNLDKNLALDHLGRCHHTSGPVVRHHLPDMHLKHPKH